MELVLIAVGLSMDAFAVALCKGLAMRRINYAHAAVISLFFGAFQALMPLAGWFLGTQFARYITSVDHWIAFAPAVLTIGGITFALSFAGVAIGNRFGTRFEKKAEIAGGAVLILIGAKILMEHLGVL